MANDIIIDTLDTLLRIVQSNGGVLLANHRTEAERIVRAAWAGERPYIARLGEVGQMEMSHRDRSIRRDFAHGAHVNLLARRYGLSERRIQCIVQGERAAVCLNRGGEVADAADTTTRAKRRTNGKFPL